MATITIQQTKSKIGAPAVQKRTLEALGLKKMNDVMTHQDTPALRGMIRKVIHLVTIVDTIE